MTCGCKNRKKLEDDEGLRVFVAKRSGIPGMVTHVWNAAFYAEMARVPKRKGKRRK